MPLGADPSDGVAMPATSIATTRRAAAGALLLLAVSGCEEQEAEPLSSSVPTGAMLLVVTAAALFWLVRRQVRSFDRPATGPLAPLRFPRATAALLVGPVLAAGALLTTMLSHEVALGYRYATSSPFSYDDVVVLTAIVAGIATGLVAAAGGLASWARSRERSQRFTARTIVGVVVVGLGMVGDGLVWLPALVVMFLEGEREPECVPAPGTPIAV